jgi:hypothetical protein
MHGDKKRLFKVREFKCPANMKTCAISLELSRLQLNRTVRYSFSHINFIKLKRWLVSSILENESKRALSHHNDEIKVCISKHLGR